MCFGKLRQMQNGEQQLCQTPTRRRHAVALHSKAETR
jgi:hypothetical protein